MDAPRPRMLCGRFCPSRDESTVAPFASPRGLGGDYAAIAVPAVSMLAGIGESIEAIAGFVLVGLGLMLGFGILRFFGRFLPPAERYAGVAVVLLIVGVVGAVAGVPEVGYIAAALFALFGVWWVATEGVSQDQIQELMDKDRDAMDGGGL